MYKGSCLCGDIQFTITGEINDIIYCHCSKCRKAQGSAFATNGNLQARHFNFIKGEELLTKYDAGDGQYKYFCRQCGSPIISKHNSSPDTLRVRLGTIESDIVERPQAHIFVASKANWECIGDDLPQRDGD